MCVYVCVFVWVGILYHGPESDNLAEKRKLLVVQAAW